MYNCINIIYNIFMGDQFNQIKINVIENIIEYKMNYGKKFKSKPKSKPKSKSKSSTSPDNVIEII